MQKNPSNRYALPKVIISEVDSQYILEFKVKYEKLARLDRFEVKAMHYEENDIVFDEVIVNGGLIGVEYQDNKKTITVNIDGKKYSISGHKVGGKQRLLENRVSRSKVLLELSDGIEDKEGNLRKSRTEREFIVSDGIKLYSQIVGREVTTTKEIYLVKRFLAYRSDLLFYYGFINNFFHVAGNRQELWKINFLDDSNKVLIEYFKFTINDKLKNDEKYLKAYSSDDQLIKKDLEKTKYIFSALRHALMHFDYDFFVTLFNGEDIEIKADEQGNKKPLSELLDIAFLNIMIENLDRLNIDTKKEFIDNEKITLFGEELSLAKLYGLYAHTAINRVAFNKLINSFMIEDGVENETLKSYFDQQADGTAYEVDIHQNRAYKELYVQHKNLVSSVSALSDGQEIAKGNAEISALKEQMKRVTKANSLKRLEHKLRLAFGFIYSEYADYEAFKNNFDTDIKNGRFVPKDSEGKRRTFDHRELEQLKGYYEATFETRKPRTQEKLDEVAKKVDRLNLQTLIGDDTLLKFVVLMFTFIPQELKGEFLGFVKKYYHDTRHIEEDTKDRDGGFADELSVGLKLKVLDKNIRSLSILKHSLSFQTKYNKKDRSYYEDGNRHGRFYKKLAISHNQEEFDKSVYAPLFKYYAALSKLINDFEIYALAKYTTESYLTLNDVIESKQFHLKWDNKKKRLLESDSYMFSALTNETFGINKMKEVNYMRNQIAHLSEKNLFEIPLVGYKQQGKKKVPYSMKSVREKIVKAIKSEMDKTLGYDAVNDFIMKMVQLQTKLKVYADKEETIEKMKDEAQTPNDFYNIYKVKGVESINQHLLNVIGVTEAEKAIEQQIVKGNETNS